MWEASISTVSHQESVRMHGSTILCKEDACSRCLHNSCGHAVSVRTLKIPQQHQCVCVGAHMSAQDFESRWLNVGVYVRMNVWMHGRRGGKHHHLHNSPAGLVLRIAFLVGVPPSTGPPPPPTLPRLQVRALAQRGCAVSQDRRGGGAHQEASPHCREGDGTNHVRTWSCRLCGVLMPKKRNWLRMYCCCHSEMEGSPAAAKQRRSPSNKGEGCGGDTMAVHTPLHTQRL